MHTSRRSFAVVAAAVALLGCYRAATTPRPQPGVARAFPADDSLTASIRTLVDRGDVPGVVLGVLEADGTRRVVAYGAPGAGARPLGPRSVFEIGSVTKTFTATLLADMAARGEVALTDPVRKYLPAGVAVPSRAGREITLLDLATHHSALPRVPDRTPADRANPYADFSVEQLYAFLARHELRRDVGVQYEYSNLGVGLLGHALGRAAGRPFDRLVRERVLDPLGLRMTGFAPAGEMTAWRTRGHDARGQVVPAWDATDAIAGAGGLWSTAEDMLTFVAANLGPPASPLARAMRDAHGRRRDVNAQQGVGLAWLLRRVGDHDVVGHTGSTGGFRTFVAFDPRRRVGVVLLANSSAGEGPLNQLGFDLLVPPPPAVAVAEAVLARYVGEYALVPGRAIVVTLERGMLVSQATGQAKQPLVAASETTFHVGRMGAPTTLRFAPDTTGAVAQAFLRVNNGTERPAPKVR